MIGTNRQMTPRTVRKESPAEKVFANTDILLTIVEFIPDHDLLSFLLVIISLFSYTISPSRSRNPPILSSPKANLSKSVCFVTSLKMPNKLSK